MSLLALPADYLYDFCATHLNDFALPRSGAMKEGLCHTLAIMGNVPNLLIPR
jgi:hypothetical protein